MNLKDHTNDDGKKVWLSQREVEQLLEATGHTEQRIAIGLGVRCGLRSAEVLDVAPQDVVDTDAGRMVRVWEGKGDKYRETPIPSELATTIRTIGDVRDEAQDVPVVDVTTRTLRRWVSSIGDELTAETGEKGWTFLSFHDLRRTWATALRDEGVDAEMALEWGGWEDLETFLEHYKGRYSPEAQRRARNSVEWL
jgi:integrase